jgi:hypothetical protein
MQVSRRDMIQCDAVYFSRCQRCIAVKTGCTEIFRVKRSDWSLRDLMVFLVRDGGPGQLSRYIDSLRQDIPGIETDEGKIFRTRPHRLGCPPSLL